MTNHDDDLGADQQDGSGWRQGPSGFDDERDATHRRGDEDEQGAEPLLVRPFLLHHLSSRPSEQSGQTWPWAAPREVRSHKAGAAEAPATAARAATPGRSPYRRRLLVVTGGGMALVLAATAAGYAALRTDARPSVSAALPGSPLPLVTGPAPSGSPRPSPASASPAARHSRSRATAAAMTASATPSASKSASAPASSSPSTGTAGGGPGTPTPNTPNTIASRPTANVTGTISGQNGLCLDLNNSLADDDNFVQAYMCNGTVAQVWTLTTDGTMQVLGKCAQVDGDSTVHIVTCDGRAAAQWKIAGSTLVSADGKCLTDPSGGATSGTVVTVTACGTGAEQHWSMP